MGPNDTADIRRALDRLQQSFEILNDRYRELRRERKQLRERIDELHRDQELTQVASSTQLEMASRDRQRVSELEEQLHGAERRNEELFNRAADLERSVAERDTLIAEQEDLLARLKENLQGERQKEEEQWVQGERLREEAEELRVALERAREEAARYRAQLEGAPVVAEGDIVVPAATLDDLRSEAVSLRQLIAQLQQDRVEMEGKHLQAIGKLDAATLAEAMARTEVAALESEKETLETSLAELREAQTRLEEQIAANAPAGSSEEDAERELARERQMQELHAELAQRQETYAAESSLLQERLAAAELERERLERHTAELRVERDLARQGADSLKMQLQQLEAGDDDRLKTQRLRIEQLTADLNLALDVASRKEIEAAKFAQDLEEAQRQLLHLNDELEALRTDPAPENGLSGESAMLDQEERRQIAAQIDTAIRLIDRHLQDE